MAKKKKQKTGIPELFLERLEKIAQSKEVFIKIQRTFKECPTTFRVNTIRSNKEEVESFLNQDGFRFKPVEWYEYAYILTNKSKRELTDTQIYKDGKIYIQSLASMVPVLALDPKPGEKVLDLTAAPGSKTSQIAMHMNLEGELTANDINKVRFFKLKHNLELLGAGEFVNLRMEHGANLCREFEENTFDKILLDAPCSAETRFKEDVPKSYMFWSRHKLKDMAYKQRKLLLSAWRILKPGGTLVYSTCTFAPEENELQIQKLLEKNEDVEILTYEIPGLKKLPILKSWNDKEIDPRIQNTLRIFPTEEIEGFYIAKLQKND